MMHFLACSVDSSVSFATGNRQCVRPSRASHHSRVRKLWFYQTRTNARLLQQVRVVKCVHSDEQQIARALMY